MGMSVLNQEAAMQQRQQQQQQQAMLQQQQHIPSLRCRILVMTGQQMTFKSSPEDVERSK